MPVTYDGNFSSAVFNNVASPQSWTHTANAGSNRALLCDTGWDVSLGAVGVTCKYNGVSLTYAGAQAAAGNRRMRQHVLAAPATGANTLEVSWTDGNVIAGVFVAADFVGADQTTPIRSGTPVAANGNDTAPTVTVTSQADDLVFDGLDHGGVTETAGGGQTERFAVASDGRRIAGSDEAGAASVTMSWTTGVADPWAICGLSLAAVGAAAAAGNQNLCLLLGVT